MSNSNRESLCQAVKGDGQRCALKAGSSGFCHLHDPEKVKEREAAREVAAEAARLSWKKGNTLREVISIIQSVCSAKGWRSHTSSIDESNWRFATVVVTRSFRTGITAEEVTGVLDLTVDGGVRLSMENPSFHGYGLRDLRDAIMAELTRTGKWKSVDKKPKEAKLDSLPALDTVESIVKRFHSVAQQLRHRHDKRDTLIIEDEYDVQDLLHALLKCSFDDVRAEESSPSYAGGSSRLDFLLKKERIVIEAKMTSKKLKDRQVGEQLIIDIKRYQAHPDCAVLICMVYDPGGHLKNRAGLQTDLSGKHDNLHVRVLVVP